jgi:predicted GTPase
MVKALQQTHRVINLILYFFIMRRKAIILGAAGRDFHNFNTFFRKNKDYQVVGFTAAQIPDISGRKYPKELSGSLYPKGIPIFDESDLESIISKKKVDDVFFSYSDVSAEYVMELAARSQSAGASFHLLGPDDTMLKSKKKVIAVTAVRTGCGKSPLTRKIAEELRKKKKKFVVIRHPMPYGDLAKQAVQRFSKMSDLDKHECTIEEREEYEPHIQEGTVVYAGVDYELILRAAEKEADIILWDGGNNDFPFFRPDLHLVVADALRPGHEAGYYPGETNVLMADAIIINKADVSRDGANQVKKNIAKMNPKVKILKSGMRLSTDSKLKIENRKVVVVEDGPTVTHGGMGTGAGYRFAWQHGARIFSAKDNAVGSIKKAFSEYEHLDKAVPAMGYSGKQLDDLRKTLMRCDADIIVSGTPVDLGHIIKLDKQVVHVDYSFYPMGWGIGKLIKGF